MLGSFIGKGWKFPVGVDKDTGKITMSEAEQDIKEAIWIILSTDKGERMMRPDFGCDIHRYVFAEMNVATLSMIELCVKEALVRWEPRIDVLGVKAKPDYSASGRLEVAIDYSVRMTNNKYNLVYPFYLNEG